jgi:PRTRC genetic system protein C
MVIATMVFSDAGTESGAFMKEQTMAIDVKEIQRCYRYNGIQLPDVPGMSPREVRDLYSAQYPELISAEIDAGEIRNGVQEITFKRAVGTKG